MQANAARILSKADFIEKNEKPSKKKSVLRNKGENKNYGLK